MADYILITPEQLKEALAQAQTDDASQDYAYAKEQLDQLSQSAKMTQDIYTVLQKYDIPNISESWQGEAQQAFVAKYQGMKDKFNKFDEALEKYAVDMDETADIMQETDQSLASKINGLT